MFAMSRIASALRGCMKSSVSKKNTALVFASPKNAMDANSSVAVVLLQLNLADDYFKARSEIRQLQKQVEEREQELADLKHELVAVQMKLEAAAHRKTEG